MNRRSWRAVICAAILCGVVGCDKTQSLTKDDVSLAKGTVLEMDKSLSLGQAIDNYKYFNKPVKWEAVKTENGKRAVKVTASTDTATHPIYNHDSAPTLKELDILLLFIINVDNTVQMGGCGIDLVKANGEKVHDADLTVQSCINRLQKIYDNSPDVYNLQGIL